MEIINKLDYTQDQVGTLIRKTVAWCFRDKCVLFGYFHIASVLLTIDLTLIRVIDLKEIQC